MFIESLILKQRTLQSRRLRRHGATLLELLTVIIVLLMITTATIPVVAPHVQGRRIREGARMLSTFINSARSRAFETQRPAGIWIERMPNLPEASVMVHYAEIPPVYAGDFLDSTVECCTVGKATGSTDFPRTDESEYYNVVIPRNRTRYQTDLWALPDQIDLSSGGDRMQQQLVREGDQIRFEGIDRYYTLRIISGLNVNGDPGPWWYILKGYNSNSPYGNIDNKLDTNNRYVIRWFGGSTDAAADGSTVVRTTDAPLTNDNAGLRYQIHRRPIRLQAGSLRMPEGVLIDLNFSVVTDGTTVDAGTPFHPRNGAGYFVGNAFYPNDTSPIVIVFTPAGHVQRLYRPTKEATGSRWSWEATEPYGDIYLLVGERRCMYPTEVDISAATQLKKNWLNLDALWVKVNSQTGIVSTSLVDNVSVTTTTASPDSLLYISRSKAQRARGVGGR